MMILHNINYIEIDLLFKNASALIAYVTKGERRSLFEASQDSAQNQNIIVSVSNKDVSFLSFVDSDYSSR